MLRTAVVKGERGAAFTLDSFGDHEAGRTLFI